MAPRGSKGGKAKQSRNEGSANGQAPQQQQPLKEEPPADPLTGLVRWLTTSGGDCSKLELQEQADHERGVHAKVALEKGDAIFTVPGDAFLSAGDLQAHASGSIWLKWASSLLQKGGGSAAWPRQQVEILLLGVLLLLERRKAVSTSKAYLASLPWDTVTHLPFTWAPELIERRLGGAAPQWELLAKRRALEKLYGELLKRCKDAGKAGAEFAEACPSSEDLVRVYALVQARAMSIPTKDSTGAPWEVALVPFADMLNHSKDPCVAWDVLPGSPPRFVGRALRAIKVGEELRQCYSGTASPLAFFASYGFLVAGTEDVPPQAFLVRPQDQADGRKELEEDVEVKATSGASLRRLLSQLRVAVAAPEERKRLLQGIGATSAKDAARMPISVKNEVETLTILQDIVKRRLGAIAERAPVEEELADSDSPAATLRRADRTGWERLQAFTSASLAAAEELGECAEEDAAVRLALEEHRALRKFTGSAKSLEPRSYSSAMMKLVESGTAKGRGFFAKSAMPMGTLLLVEEPDVLDGSEDDFMGVAAALMLGNEAKAQKGEGRLRGSQDDFGEDGQADKDFATAARWLRGVVGMTAERARAACAVAANNGFRSTLAAVREEDPMLLFQSLAMFNHSCWPNCASYRDEATGVTKVCTLKAIGEGEELTIHYSDELILLPTALRRTFMKGRFGFHCQCERCTASEGSQDFPIEAALTEPNEGMDSGPAAAVAMDGMRRAHASICRIQHRRLEHAGFAYREFSNWEEALAAVEAAMPKIAAFGSPTFWARHHAQALRCLALEGLQRDAAAYLALAEHAAAAILLLPPRCEGLLELHRRIQKVRSRLPEMLAPRLEAKATEMHGNALQTLEEYVAETRAWLEAPVPDPAGDAAPKPPASPEKAAGAPDGKQGIEDGGRQTSKESQPRYAWPAPVDFVLPPQGKNDAQKAAAIREAAAAKVEEARKAKKGKK